MLEIALSDPRNLSLIDELAILLNKKLRVRVATLSQIADLLKKTEQSQRVLEEVTEGFTLDVVGPAVATPLPSNSWDAESGPTGDSIADSPATSSGLSSARSSRPRASSATTLCAASTGPETLPAEAVVGSFRPGSGQGTSPWIPSQE